MSVRCLDGVRDTIYREEGVVATRSTAGFCIRVPYPVSSHHQFGIAGALWEIWAAIRDQVVDSDHECIVDVSAVENLPLPLIYVLAAMDGDMNQAGRKLISVGARQGDHQRYT
ncbi:MAG: hypothetical protein HZB26_05365 [Candidatus Hydrogenedentes bacterium]|nr:hypothetical protein [Candidatus Hydrogenedentota bacterium]